MVEWSISETTKYQSPIYAQVENPPAKIIRSRKNPSEKPMIVGATAVSEC